MLLGRTDEARSFAREFVALLQELPDKPPAAGDITEFADELGLAAEMRELVEAAPPGRFQDAALAELDGDFERAAGIFADLGSLPDEADARLRAAEKLVDAGRRAEGEVELHKALDFYRSVGATFSIERAETLLASAQRESA